MKKKWLATTAAATLGTIVLGAAAMAAVPNAPPSILVFNQKVTGATISIDYANIPAVEIGLRMKFDALVTSCGPPAVVTTVGLQDRLGAQIDELQAKLSNQPQIEYVAVLNDEQASASMLVTFDPKNRKLTLQRVGGYQEASDKSLQLWALPPGSKPRSLGVLSQEKLLQLAAGEGDAARG